jgi:YgiT-type zinc finger domain-containing protein
MTKKNNQLDLRINGELFLIDGAEFEECPKCGERVVDPETAEEIFCRVKNGSYRRKPVEVAVLDLQSGI